MNSYILDPNYIPRRENMIEVYPDEGYARVYYQNKQSENIGYFTIDIEDIPIVRRYKWHKAVNNNYELSGFVNTNGTIRLINLILRFDINNIKCIRVIFKNEDRSDLRKQNLETIYFTRYIYMRANIAYDLLYKDNKGMINSIFHSKYLDEIIYASYILRLNYNKITDTVLDNDLLELKKFSKFISEERKEEIKFSVDKRIKNIRFN